MRWLRRRSRGNEKWLLAEAFAVTFSDVRRRERTPTPPLRRRGGTVMKITKRTGESILATSSACVLEVTMNKLIGLLPLVASVVFTVTGCSSSGNAPPDPTSRQALMKPPPMEFGTTCTKVDISSYGTAHSHVETPMCLQADGDCGKLNSSSASDFGGGAA